MSEMVGKPIVGTLSIGEVLSLLKRDFRDITISKIRFLEAEGLITPERTASGYRRFAERDVVQLRSVLTMQRDQYLPLKVIREQLEEGVDDASVPLAGTGQRPEDFRPGAGRVRLTRVELAEQVDLPESVIVQLESHGLVWASPAGHYDEDALAIAGVVARLSQFGVEPRHLRSFRVVADRDSGLLEQIATPYSKPRDRDARAKAQETIRELAALFVQLHATLLRAELVRGGKG
jgi:DNA-binding transcriptional MerR regulator